MDASTTAVNRQPNNSFYTISDVMNILGCKRTKASYVIRDLNEELAKTGYFSYPSGKVSKKYFDEKFYR